jgi:hypothetical protein
MEVLKTGYLLRAASQRGLTVFKDSLVVTHNVMKGFADSCDYNCHLASCRVCAEQDRELTYYRTLVLKGPTSVIRATASVCVRVNGFVDFLSRFRPSYIPRCFPWC